MGRKEGAAHYVFFEYDDFFQDVMKWAMQYYQTEGKETK